jgi:Cd2+/Zn2+-exporting ATPase
LLLLLLFIWENTQEAAVVIVLYVLGERLEDISLENSKSALDQLVKYSPKKAAFVKSENKIFP